VQAIAVTAASATAPVANQAMAVPMVEAGVDMVRPHTAEAEAVIAEALTVPQVPVVIRPAVIRAVATRGADIVNRW
jgi:hypothetical protein